MNQDPIVEEIHDIREQLLQECGGDITQLMARLKAEEAQDKARLITRRGLQERAERRQKHQLTSV
jgi:hypothetical protein